jgi:NADH-quinone oxidoreductase subunit C
MPATAGGIIAGTDEIAGKNYAGAGSMEPIGIAQELRKRFNDSVSEITSHRGQVAVLVERTPIVEICRWLKTDYQMNHLNCLCGVDNRNRKAPHGERFEVVYQLYSIPNRVTLRLKAQVPESDPAIDSITSLWSGANWLEREAYDLFGIVFHGHPNLQRILTAEGWEGYPLRKEYALRGDTEWQGFIELKEKARELRKFDFYGAQNEQE